MVRLIHGTRSWTQIMVGTSSTSMTAQVMTASSRVISTALEAGPGRTTICVQAATDQVPSLLPSRENLTIARNGSRKKARTP